MAHISVFMKMSAPVECGVGVDCSETVDSNTSLHFIGFLEQLEITYEPEDFEQKARELANHGVTLRVYTNGSRHPDGRVGMSIYYGVEVADFTAARDLPGFRSVCLWANYRDLSEQKAA